MVRKNNVFFYPKEKPGYYINTVTLTRDENKRNIRPSRGWDSLSPGFHVKRKPRGYTDGQIGITVLKKNIVRVLSAITAADH